MTPLFLFETDIKFFNAMYDEKPWHWNWQLFLDVNTQYVSR